MQFKYEFLVIIIYLNIRDFGQEGLKRTTSGNQKGDWLHINPKFRYGLKGCKDHCLKWFVLERLPLMH